MGSIYEKIRGKKSRDTAPLRRELWTDLRDTFGWTMRVWFFALFALKI